MQTFVKWVVIAANVFAIILFLGLYQYAHGRHTMEVEDAYQGLILRGLLDEGKSEAYAKDHNGWNPKDRLQDIGNPDGFVSMLSMLGFGVCIFNVVAILVLTRKKNTPLT